MKWQYHDIQKESEKNFFAFFFSAGFPPTASSMHNSDCRDAARTGAFHVYLITVFFPFTI